MFGASIVNLFNRAALAFGGITLVAVLGGAVIRWARGGPQPK